ncbi:MULTISPECIES: hypothetical protein [Streptomyces]|uniref:hypothetical protein n=1 Tax=Streptomyces TaxID=1883 RepID=UPI0036A55CDE
MPTFATETVTSTTRRWIVPAAEPIGAYVGDITAALRAAAVTYREVHGMPADELLADDSLTVHAQDDQIVIGFTTEEPTR